MDTGGSYAEVNGLRMYYEVHGEGPPLLLLHGGTCSIGLPSMEIPFFANEFQVIAPEQPVLAPPPPLATTHVPAWQSCPWTQA